MLFCRLFICHHLFYKEKSCLINKIETEQNGIEWTADARQLHNCSKNSARINQNILCTNARPYISVYKKNHWSICLICLYCRNTEHMFQLNTVQWTYGFNSFLYACSEKISGAMRNVLPFICLCVYADEKSCLTWNS